MPWTPERSSIDIIAATLTTAGQPARQARRLAFQIVDDMFLAGWTPTTRDTADFRVWAWLLEHGLDLDIEHITDPDLRVTLDLEAC